MKPRITIVMKDRSSADKFKSKASVTLGKSERVICDLGEDLIDEIGEYVGLSMWSKRDRTRTYSYPGCRDGEDEHADDYVNGEVINFNGIYLLLFKPEGGYGGYDSEYTLNLSTLRPTKNSHIKKELSLELKAKINL
jgi:hypothetical protein